MSFILSLETSCDDSSVAIVRQDGFVVRQLSVNQNTRHERFGGVVPEIASRAHAEVLSLLVEQVLEETGVTPKELTALAVTARPGLIGSLWVGVSTAWALAQAWTKPLVSVNHLHGHIVSSCLWDSMSAEPVLPDPRFPALVLAVSGGHTSLYWWQSPAEVAILGQTRDDAAGEALDKVAKLLGLGFPGGAALDRLVQDYLADPSADFMPGPWNFRSQDLGYSFSFSGLKSAAYRAWEALSEEQKNILRPKLAYAFQKAVITGLLRPLWQATLQLKPQWIAVVGGVSANSYLRKVLQEPRSYSHLFTDEERKQFSSLWHKPCPIVLPPLRYCSDNAAMIGLAAWYFGDRYRNQAKSYYHPADPGSSPPVAETTSQSQDFLSIPL
ncbi:MAG: tRNA (adenosine(37)-N6)-threonylcarbamoyltransferase complex transferase subunit TsaD [Bdellovibrionaceae bacterium]|jgi:N6-L-threonylcarbamoyladenine synthase|nr:tRNA (adenosine(37)-N6)-threonylcarbamoyltransferase complex transferase subunit TsaD [Pseudobdellovibrionaceae bacterium]